MKNEMMSFAMVLVLVLLSLTYSLYGQGGAGISSVENGIRDFAHKSGRPMTSQEFQTYLEQNIELFPSDPLEYMKTAEKLIKVLDDTRPKGIISVEDIADIYEFRRDSLETIEVSVNRSRKIDLEKSKGLFDTKMAKYGQESRFATQNGMLFYEVQSSGTKSIDDKLIYDNIERRAFDGNSEYYFTGDNHDGGVLKKENHVKDFFLANSWPTIAGLMGYKTDSGPFYCNIPKTFRKIKGLAYVEPEVKTIKGVKVICVKYGIPEVARFYFDPERDYVPLMVEIDSTVKGESVRQILNFSGYKQSSDGIWLATKFNEKRMRFDGSKWIEFFWDEYSATNITINENIDEKIFGPSNVFVPGLTVLDANLGSVYIYGGKTIDALEDIERAEVLKTIALGNVTSGIEKSNLQHDIVPKDTEPAKDIKSRANSSNQTEKLLSRSDIALRKKTTMWKSAIVLLSILSIGFCFILYKRRLAE